MTMPDSQWYPSKLYLINNVEDIVVFLGLSDNICFPAVEMAELLL